MSRLPIKRGFSLSFSGFPAFALLSLALSSAASAEAGPANSNTAKPSAATLLETNDCNFTFIALPSMNPNPNLFVIYLESRRTASLPIRSELARVADRYISYGLQRGRIDQPV